MPDGSVQGWFRRAPFSASVTEISTQQAYALGGSRHRDLPPSAIRPTRDRTTLADPRICASVVLTTIKSIRMSYLIAMLINRRFTH
ncbi:hypothetical protein SAMN05660971_03694 [Halomonas cupida]|uniref:Uncharacterized protein n=1 Tax=Halomonas cupida TaxID=44933 RepID=A0A1M7L1I3_9GAMM|nr:hypothetical protein SAMN05660971_03694 [Halomonas cupida]